MIKEDQKRGVENALSLFSLTWWRHLFVTFVNQCEI